nr:hypothetical protein [Tanacetum cinerariifolium]
AAPPGYFSELRHMHNEDFLRQYNINLAQQVAMGSQLHLRFEQEAKLLRKSVAQVDALHQQVYEEETLKAAFEDYKRQQDQMVEQQCAEMDAHLDAMSIDFDKELYPHMLTAIAGRRWVIGHGLRLATIKCAESLEMRHAFADVVSARIAIGMSEDLKHGHAQRTDNTGEDAPQFIRDLQPSSSQLSILVYPEKKRRHIVCRTHGVGSAHHARSDRVPVSIPIVVPQGLALLLVDVATQTESDDA